MLNKRYIVVCAPIKDSEQPADQSSMGGLRIAKFLFFPFFLLKNAQALATKGLLSMDDEYKNLMDSCNFGIYRIYE